MASCFSNFCKKTQIILFLSISVIVALFTTFVFKVFHVLDIFIEKFLNKWNNEKGVNGIVMSTTIIILTAILSFVFLCYYKITKNQEKSIVILQQTKALIEYTDGAKALCIRQTEDELGSKYRKLANKPDDKILSGEIREIEKKLDRLHKRDDNISY